MGTEFECNACGSITEATAGRCPICGTVVPVDPATGQPTPGPPPQPGPTPRVDPYSQFGNPLHDTWGTPQSSQQTLASQPTRVHTARKKRPWVNRTIAVVILLALLGGSWLGRSWLDEQWDSLYETLEGWTGDDDPPQISQGSETPFGEIDLSGVETVEYRDSPENRDFLEWEEDHSEQLNTLADNLMISFEAEIDKSASRTEAADEVATASARIGELLELVDTAPDSQLRTAAVTMFMQMLHAFELLERAILEGSPALAREADAAVRELGVTMKAYTGFASESIIFGS